MRDSGEAERFGDRVFTVPNVLSLLRLAAPETVVDLSRVTEMRGVRDDGDAIVIGAMTTHHDVLVDPLIAQHAPLIAEATETVADRQVRARGTFGGGPVAADPGGEPRAAGRVPEAEVVIPRPLGRRSEKHTT